MLRAIQHVRPYSRSQMLLHSSKRLFAIKPIGKRLQDAVEHDIYNTRDAQIPEKKYQRVAKTSYNLNKALKSLKDRYDAVAFIDNDQKAFNIHRLKIVDLKYNSPMAKVIFDNLLRIKEVTGRQIDRNLALALLGTDGAQLSDEFYVSNNVNELLSLDGDISRALYLCRIAKSDAAIVGMNFIMQWLLARGKIEEALKIFNSRKSSGIPSSKFTYITLLDGIAKQLEWGYPNRKYIWKAIRIFKNWRAELAKKGETVPIEGFNACLSILVKDFTNRQALAWKFFDELEEDKEQGFRRIDADAQTFTILLQGIKKYTDVERNTLMKDKNIGKNPRLLLLMDLEAGHIKIAQLVMDRAKQLATPPKKTGDEEVDEKAIRYWNRTKLEIDMPLVSVYINSLISRNSGTGPDLRLGSHYLYNQTALSILRQVSPEIDGLLNFIEKVTNAPVCQPSEQLKKTTDARFNDMAKNPGNGLEKIKYVKDLKSLNPRNVVAELNVDNFNPQVIIPRNSGFPKNSVSMIDFTRKSGNDSNLKSQYGVNKFLLNQTFDCLVNLGRWNELVIAYWYSFVQWGGLKVDLTLFHDRPNVVTGVLKKSELLEPTKSDKRAIPTIIDELMPRFLITKVWEDQSRVANGSTKTHLILELFQLLVNKKFNSNGVILGYDTLKRLWPVLNKDINYYHRSNERFQTQDKIPGMSYKQAEEFARNLVMMNTVTRDWARKFTNLRRVPLDYYDNMNKVLERVYGTKWLDVTLEQTIYIHKLLVKACIKYYKPQLFVKPYEADITYPRCIQVSFSYLIKTLQNMDNLTAENLRLLNDLRKLRGMKPHTKTDADESELKALLKEIHDIIDVDDQTLTKSTTVKENAGSIVKEEIK